MKPIIFSAAMIRATIAKRKTMTRRVIKPAWFRCLDFEEPKDIQKALAQCPYGQPGDQLWVRETFAIFPDIRGGPNYYSYKADLKINAWKDHTKWKPAIFMPRSAARLFLEIEAIRIEPLQQISKGDAIKEGIYWSEAFPEGYTIGQEIPKYGTAFGSAEGCYKALWDSLNFSRGFGFDTNPFVWVISFKLLPSPSQISASTEMKILGAEGLSAVITSLLKKSILFRMIISRIFMFHFIFPFCVRGNLRAGEKNRHLIGRGRGVV